MNHLGTALQYSDPPKSISYFDQSIDKLLSWRNQINDRDPKLFQHACGLLYDCYQKSGRETERLKQMEQDVLLMQSFGTERYYSQIRVNLSSLASWSASQLDYAKASQMAARVCQLNAKYGAKAFDKCSELLKYAWYLRSHKQIDAAQAVFKQCLEESAVIDSRHRQYPEWLLLLAEDYQRQGQHAKSVELLRIAIERLPQVPDGHLERAVSDQAASLYSLKKGQEAFALLNSFISGDRLPVGARWGLATQMAMFVNHSYPDRVTETKNLCLRLFRLETGSPDVDYSLSLRQLCYSSIWFARSGNFHEMIELLAPVESSLTNGRIANAGAAYIFADQLGCQHPHFGFKKLYKQCIDRILQGSPAQSDPGLRIALLTSVSSRLARAGDYEEAQSRFSELQNLLTANPACLQDNPMIVPEIKLLEAEFAGLAGDYRKADALYLTAIDLSRRVHMTLMEQRAVVWHARFLLRRGLSEQGEALLKQALATTPRGDGELDYIRGTAHLQLAASYSRQGKWKLAKEEGLDARNCVYALTQMDACEIHKLLTLVYGKLGANASAEAVSSQCRRLEESLKRNAGLVIKSVPKEKT